MMTKDFLARLVEILNENQGIVVHISVEKIPVSLESNGGNSLTVGCYGQYRKLGKPDGTIDELHAALYDIVSKSNQYFEKLGELEWNS